MTCTVNEASRGINTLGDEKRRKRRGDPQPKALKAKTFLPL